MAAYNVELSKNINRNYFFTFFQNFNLTSTIWMIYLAFRGLSLAEIGIVEGIFHITSFCMEVPTGAIADIFGRKTSRLLGRIFSVFSSVVMITANNFWMFAFAFMVSAVSYNLESGAGQALIYDSMLETRTEKNYMKVCGKLEFITQIAMLSGYVAGGYLGKINYLYVYIGAMIIGIISILIAVTFKEPDIKREEEHITFKTFIAQTKDSFIVVKGNKKLLYLILFIEFIEMTNTSLFFYLQNYFLGEGYNQFYIGIIMALAALAAAGLSVYAHKIEKMLGEKNLLMILPAISCICIWGIACTNLAVVFFVIMNSLGSVIFVAYNDYINRLIPSDKRATILSFCSMSFSIYMIVLFPIMGKIGDMFGLKASFLVLGMISLIMVIINIIILIKKDRKGA